MAFLPVRSQGRVVRRRPSPDQHVTTNRCPFQLPQVSSRGFVHEYPFVLARTDLPPVPLLLPPPGLVWVSARDKAFLSAPHPGVEALEGPLGRPRAKVVAPPSYLRIEGADNFGQGETQSFPPDVLHCLSKRPDGFPRRLRETDGLASPCSTRVSPYRESQEVESLLHVGDARFAWG